MSLLWFLLLIVLSEALETPGLRLNNQYNIKNLDGTSLRLPANVKQQSNLPARFKLIESPVCADDIRRICASGVLNNNFAVLDCLQNDKKREDDDLTPDCHHLIWNFKKNLTTDSRFAVTAKNICRKFLDSHSNCKPLENAQGHLLSCLMDYAENATEPECRSFLKKMGVIVFSDYRLIYKFAEECEHDINKFQCGRVDMNNEDPHSQGETIECLSKHTDELADQCRHEILRIAELQGDDFNLDRPLYFACRDDRERFCEKVDAGEGRVYRCLMRHKMERDMSQDCREKLFQREKLVVRDYKVNRGLAKACRENIKIYRCRDETSDKREIRLAQILLCLENALHKGYPVAGECQAEMMEHRRTLMENYQLTPELTAACKDDIRTLCKRFEFGVKTLHCLMEHAKPSRFSQKRISDICRRELELILKESDVASDWRVDPVLQESCQSVVDAVCSEEKPGDGRVMICMMKHFDSHHMTDECKEKLLQIQYFVARDFKLDPVLYKKCRKEAEDYCHAKKEWHDMPSRMDPERGPIVLPCLYRYAYHVHETVKLSSECLYEVRRVMKQRAVSVDLLPEVEEPCITDLSSFCNENVEKGEEMKCLQQHLNDLSFDCQKAVKNFTEEEAEHIELNYPLFYSCTTILHKYCNDLLSRDVDRGDLIQCLILHKNEADMKQNQKCRTAVEHFQLITMKDYRFSFKFKEACKKDVLHLCKNVKSKQEVVNCLSSIVTNDTLSDREEHHVSLQCRQQLKFELLERNENIKLDSTLDADCSIDQKKFCSNVSPGEAQVLECLKDHRKNLSPNCHRAIFNREKEEMADNSVDYLLLTTCKSMIKKFCPEREMSTVLDCLKEKRDDNTMERGCRKLIIKRMVEQNTDYRLNPRLQQACIRDIPKFCSSVLVGDHSDKGFQGKVINCLKQQYRKNKKLSVLCESEILGIMRDSGRNVNLDPQLLQACSLEIEKKCKEATDVEECLKMKFQKKELDSEECKREVARWIFDGKADVQSDPHLFKACVIDIKKLCFGIPPGHGKQLSCLMSVLQNEPTDAPLSAECRAVLSNRVEMFEFAAQVAPAETVEELFRQVSSSPARNYFIVIAFGILGAIFIGGLFCGRITKRVPISVKNK